MTLLLLPEHFWINNFLKYGRDLSGITAAKIQADSPNSSNQQVSVTEIGSSGDELRQQLLCIGVSTDGVMEILGSGWYGTFRMRNNSLPLFINV